MEKVCANSCKEPQIPTKGGKSPAKLRVRRANRRIHGANAGIHCVADSPVE